MAINLNNRDPIFPTNPQYRRMLQNLQGNILKGHGRKNSAHIFLVFKHLSAVDLCNRLAEIADEVITSAWEQHEQSKNKKREPYSMFGSLFLTANGYRKLGCKPEGLSHATDYFLEGMKNKYSVKELQDPDPKDWEKEYRDNQIDAMVLLANENKTRLKNRVKAVMRKLAVFSTSLTPQYGQVKKRKGQSIEHFGYVDGISQPIFLQTDPAWPKKFKDRNLWTPSAPLSVVLVRDTLTKEKECFGSYLVFRKLEQDAVGFALARAFLAKDLKSEETRIGGMMVGRFENGTPLALSDLANKPLKNNFIYTGDPQGLKCPVFAHARIANSRTKAERPQRIARRGVLYDDRPLPITDIPRKGDPAGLLFLCFQRSIEDQFVYIQQQANTGHDPIIRASSQGISLDWPVEWGKGSKTARLVQKWVTLKGGEYFFAPSLPFFANLGEA